MKKLLQGLNENIGVRGSLIMTRDGVLVEDCLNVSLEQETIAALASSLLNTFSRTDSSFRVKKPCRVTLSAKHGSLIFEIMESLVLVTVVDKGIDIDVTMLEITGLARRLQRMTRIEV